MTAARLSNAGKVFWPEQGWTKADLAAYYERVFLRLKPWLVGRLLTLERCPDGVRGRCFYQKQAPAGLPRATPTRAIPHAHRVTRYVVGGSLETELALVNLGCIAVHVWGSREDAPRQPDWACFDIDPVSGRFAKAVRAARSIRAALDALRLTSFVKTSGGRGLHVFVPIRRGPDADDVLAFAKAIGARRGRVYLDPFRNGFGQTVVAPWSVRHREGAPISTPLAWDELESLREPGRYNLRTIDARLAAADPWKGFFGKRQVLPR